MFPFLGSALDFLLALLVNEGMLSAHSSFYLSAFFFLKKKNYFTILYLNLRFTLLVFFWASFCFAV